MFKSFFPKPGPFFMSAFVWALIAVIFWQAGGGDWVARLVGASDEVPISAARFWSLDYLIFLCLLPDLRGIICNVLVHL
ncbi:transport protein [Salmonella enterica subsp. enterica serovar Newport str. CVM 19443]|uniref:Transport protein n=1 Tax=Salmonella enterica subsp. enterica serovar Daytona TaxID=1962639 RepID=A0A447JMI7_SALET|nr:transport protein [Salmonella enterica subsp. enterica serovar Newport str. CVM 19443]VDY45098.1 transport protein [Salmonella enterica subsp. enterica serovar Daytona]